MQPTLSIAELVKREEALAYSRRLMAQGLRGPEKWEPLKEEFGYE